VVWRDTVLLLLLLLLLLVAFNAALACDAAS